MAPEKTVRPVETKADDSSISYYHICQLPFLSAIILFVSHSYLSEYHVLILSKLNN